jgi:LPXTG-site transpeptidase (sortase) family protein
MRRTRSTVTAAAALAVAAVTAVWAGATLAASDTPEGPRQFDVREDVREIEANAAPKAQPKPSPVPTRSADPTTPAPPQPRELDIPALGVSSAVVPTGVTKAGNAQIPRDGDLVGWYEFGTAPGEDKGSAVLIGHRDTKAEGPGALYDLDGLQPGDVLTVRSGPKTYRYEVAALRSIEKAGLPDSLFRRGGPHQLVVITCGGAYIPEAGGYQENLFAVALPVDR